MFPNAGQLAHHFLKQDNPTGWFEPLYARANWDERRIPWAGSQPHPSFLEWLERQDPDGMGQKALVIGCGLGDDAEELARHNFEVTAFDISPTAIEWCRRRFPRSRVDYQVADLFDPPPAWPATFDFVLEVYTIQALPPSIRPETIEAVARLVAPGGTLLVISNGRSLDYDPGGPPWPLTKRELAAFQGFGLEALVFEDYLDQGLTRRFRVTYQA